MKSLSLMSNDRKLRAALMIGPMMPMAFLLTLFRVGRLYKLRRRRQRANNVVVKAINKMRAKKRIHFEEQTQLAKKNCNKYVM